MTLTESQRKRVADMWRNYTSQYGGMTKHYIEFTEKIFAELAPEIRNQALEEAAKECYRLDRQLMGNSIRALKEKT